jgi:hypothetical protein
MMFTAGVILVSLVATASAAPRMPQSSVTFVSHDLRATGAVQTFLDAYANM